MAASNPRVALVTGSTGAIGLGIAKVFAESGYSIIVTGFGDDQLIESILGELNKLSGAGARYIPADLGKPDEIEELYRKVKEIYPDGIDILINNAGIERHGLIEDFPLSEWNMMVAIMLTAPFHLTKLFLPDMKKKGWGRIVNISSVFGKVGFAEYGAYASVKHGLIGLTKTVALETATTGVTCNAICPASVDTPMVRGALAANAASKGITFEKEMTDYIGKWQPTGKLINIQQVAETVKFMCSPAADQMTGSALSLDGGWTAQ
ncbi:D-beta-hydroxybutyrate dehydrogenase-like [Glandiceps talaboti]